MRFAGQAIIKGSGTAVTMILKPLGCNSIKKLRRLHISNRNLIQAVSPLDHFKPLGTKGSK